ncbi:MAG: type II secretion system F family protein [Halobacteriovoraceae bacterium]|nr:type II secretion system F family protein [Halobacteriovoraceae bacterium]
MFDMVINQILGLKGVIFVVGFMVFVFCLKYSQLIFDWIEMQTLGTRTYIQEKLELLFIEIHPDRLTTILLGFALFCFTSVILFFGLWFSWVLGFIFGIGAAVLSFRLPKKLVDKLVHRRIKQYQNQMVDGLTLLSNGIRAGLSVPQALGMVVNELNPPISQEFGLILQQNRIGVTLEECFENLAHRVPTEDNDMFVAAINILRETGGNLAETFDTIVAVIRERIRLQQKIDTYTAQGMFQGTTIACMPFAIAGIYGASDPKSVMLLVNNPIGILATFVAIGLDFFGYFLILKIVKIKI